MVKGEIIAALDIGTTKIACLIGRKNDEGKIDILGVGKTESIGVKRGVVHNVSQTVDSIKRAVAEAEAKANCKVYEVNVGIAGQHIKSSQVPNVRMRSNQHEMISDNDIELLKNEMHKMVMIPGEEIIHVLPQEYKIDDEGGIKDPKGMFGSRIECMFHIITGQSSSAKNIQICIEQANLKINNLILEPLASSQAVLSDDERDAGVALVDIGGGTTDVAIFHGGIIRHTAVIAMGGNIVTHDIHEKCSILESQAEKLKVRFGEAISYDGQESEVIVIPVINGSKKEINKRTLSAIIEARMTEIIYTVFNEIVNSGYAKKLICGIVITGGGAQLRHLKQLVELKTGLDTRVGVPLTHLSNNHDAAVESSMHATGVGLVMSGIASAERKQLLSALSEEQIKKLEEEEKETGQKTGGFSTVLSKIDRFFKSELFND
jgi:cell division protein FtsA